MEIIFVTPHGQYILEPASGEQTLYELCLQYKIPHQATTFYSSDFNQTKILLGLYRTLSELEKEHSKIVIRPDRNIDYKAVCKKPIISRKNSEGVSEYTFPSENSQENYHFELSQQECVDYVRKEVKKFLTCDAKLDPEKKIVMGISGGGDSNTLIDAFLSSELITKNQIVAVMMLGIPDWDLGKPRAIELCNKFEIELRFVESSEVNELLGRNGAGSWVEDFEKVFPDADLEVLGTHAIRLSLFHVAREVNAQCVVTGLNLEDILAEGFLSCMQGNLPPPFPIRFIDEFNYWYPLYRIPKKIIDGCNPKYSLANYIDRYPSHMMGRTIPYYLAQMIHNILPGAEFDLIDGFKKMSNSNHKYACYDVDLGFSTTSAVSSELKNAWNIFRQM